jgi:succinate dehydrogenase / fumarate reductase flavoprotein subunit
MMGGIPTDNNGRALDWDSRPVPGLYAAGEAACISVHGANRLGCNSLIDLVVFGRRTGKAVDSDLKELKPIEPHRDSLERAGSRIAGLKSGKGRIRAGDIRARVQEAMTSLCSVYREETELESLISTLSDLKTHYNDVYVDNKSNSFNTDLVEALELEAILELAEAIAFSALQRTESRGAHYREDHPERDDNNWLKHSLVRRDKNSLEISFKPVTITEFEPKARKY